MLTPQVLDIDNVLLIPIYQKTRENVEKPDEDRESFEIQWLETEVNVLRLLNHVEDDTSRLNILMRELGRLKSLTSFTSDSEQQRNVIDIENDLTDPDVAMLAELHEMKLHMYVNHLWLPMALSNYEIDGLPFRVCKKKSVFIWTEVALSFTLTAMTAFTRDNVSCNALDTEDLYTLSLPPVIPGNDSCSKALLRTDYIKNIIISSVVGGGICGSAYYNGLTEQNDNKRTDITYYPLR